MVPSQCCQTKRRLAARAMAEPAAFAAIYDHYFPRVYNYVRYRVREADAADDIASQVFERAFGKHRPVIVRNERRLPCGCLPSRAMP